MQTIIAFDSTHHALRGEQILQQQGLQFDIIPTPREITASCGLSLSLSSQQEEQALSLLRQASVQYRAVYHLNVQHGVKSYRLQEEVN